MGELAVKSVIYISGEWIVGLGSYTSFFVSMGNCTDLPI